MKRSKEQSSIDRRYSNFSRTNICQPTWTNLGPLRMSSVNRAGSVPKFSPPLEKNSMCSYENLGWPGYRDLA